MTDSSPTYFNSSQCKSTKLAPLHVSTQELTTTQQQEQRRKTTIARLQDSYQQRSPIDLTKLADATLLVEQAMRLLWGDLLDSEGMRETPLRVVKHWQQITSGLQLDAAEPLRKRFSCTHDEIVLVKDIPVVSLCEHHLLPFFGVAHIAYIPTSEVVGLSKLARALDILARRPQLQERLTDDLAALIEQELQPKGVAVVLSCEHSCMSTRGVLKSGAKTVTSSMLGAFRSDSAARKEVLDLIKE